LPGKARRGFHRCVAPGDPTGDNCPMEPIATARDGVAFEDGPDCGRILALVPNHTRRRAAEFEA
jgi:hypothetical protein